MTRRASSWPRSGSSRRRCSVCSSRSASSRRSRTRSRGARRASSGWSVTAPRTTPRRTASTRSACSPAGPRFATRSRSPSTTAPRSTSRSSAVVALSQSGRTPDVVEYVERARADGALTIALTNEPASELGQAAELVLPLAAGPERAVAATKTYLNELAALALLAGGAAGRGPEIADGLRRVAGAAGRVPAAARACRGAGRGAFAFVGRMFVIGRGVEFATAREIALKLTETCRVAAEPLTATDLVHGPLAALDPFFPVWAIASPDESLPPSSRRRRAPVRPVRPSSRAGARRMRSPAPRTRCPSRTRATASSRRCSRSSRASSSLPRWRGRRASTPTGPSG